MPPDPPRSRRRARPRRRRPPPSPRGVAGPRAHSAPGAPSPTTRWLVRFGYDGSRFAGWARQPGHRTVEGVVRDGLVRAGIVPEVDGARLMVASRTDRGVHAVGNALALDSELRGPALLRALDGVAPDVFFTHSRAVDEGFIPRRAVRRTYRYLEPAEGRSPERWRTAAKLLTGTIDVRSFGRGLPADQPSTRLIERIAIEEDGEILRLELVAPSFVWGMVRKIVSALRQYDAGTLSAPSLKAAVAGRLRLALPLAEPERLVLWDVGFPGAWEFRRSALRARRLRWGPAEAEAALVRRAVVEALRAGSEAGS